MKNTNAPQNRFDTKKWLPIAAMIALFAVISIAYFTPVLQHKVLEQSDIKQFIGSAQEILDYRAQNDGEDPYWTNRMFGGMPSYQISAEYDYNLIKYVDSALRFLPRPADYAFIFFVSFFILMLAMRLDWKKALLGALMFGFTSYLYIILEAGHNSKAHAIAYLPLVVAAVILAYRGKYLLGGGLMALGMGLEVYANHPQMTYYMGIALAIYVIINLFKDYLNGLMIHFTKATAVLVLGVVIGIGMNAGRLWSTWSYQKHTIRGGSELVVEGAKAQKGLDKDYLLNWSYGIGETFNLMIPNLYGGASNTDLGKESQYFKAINELTQNPVQAAQMAAAAPTYWGDQPFTSGPAYVGAIVVFLFVLGAFIVRGNIKWWLLGATALSFLMAWGSSAMWFADLMIDYFPMYNKFRTPSSALIVSSITMPMLAILALKDWFTDNKHILSDKNRKRYLYISLGLTAGICAFLIFMANSVLSFSSATDKEMFGDYPTVISALMTDRHNILTSDAARSCGFILVAAALLWLQWKGKLKQNAVIISLCVLVTFDMWGVNKRYLNDSNFTTQQTMSAPFEGTVASWAYSQISADKDYFRVWNRAVNTMNDASTSYYFNSLGGYHAAKLQRYQELWDNHISKGNIEVISMLNTKYLINPPAADSQYPQIAQNPMNLGPAWVVDSIRFVSGANKELDALNDFKASQIAIVDEKFKDIAIPKTIARDSTSTYDIKLTSYQPNHLSYSANLQSDATVVFSEIYYPDGWNAYIDGQKADYFRANYILRAINIPKGQHTVEFKFEPQEAVLGDRISLISSILLLGGLAGILVYNARKRKQQ